MPVTITVLLSLGVILFISRFYKNLIYAVIGGILVLVTLSGYSFAAICDIVWNRLYAANNLFLMLVIVQVIWLSQQMKESGIMSELVVEMRRSISKKASMAVLPALIGILPMPGGALFSAPLVDDCDIGADVDPLLKTEINYWFRHIWEYWWPLYPGVLLAIDITGIPMLHFVFLQIPLTLISIVIGCIFFLRRVRNSDLSEYKLELSKVLKIVKLFSPVILLIAVFAFVRLLIPSISEFNKFFPIVIAIFVAMIFLQLNRPLKLEVLKKNFLSVRVGKLVLLVETIRVFGAFIESKLPNGVYMAAEMHSELSAWGIPVTLVIMLIPFIAALTTGIALGYVGASFPIIMTLICSEPSQSELYTTMVLAYGCGYIGLILSPVHVCLIVTNEHFRTSLITSLGRLIMPASLLFCALTGYWLLLNWIL